MKSLTRILIILLFPFISSAQDSQYFDSLNHALNNTINDTIQMDIYRNMGFYMQEGILDSALPYHVKQMELAKKLHLKLYEADAYQQIAYVKSSQGDFAEALKSARPDDKVGRDTIQISVNDNGNGIPESIKEKIFQPFFTTKPTGSGTGLGLSLSYDIVKAHGGELQLKTQEHEGTTFSIQLSTV